MGLIVKHADGSEFLNIIDKTYDETSTSLKLPGKGVLNWGEAYVNDFVHLLENFASSSAPRSPQVGQIWYNTGTGVLSVFNITQEWEIINKDLLIEEKFDEIVELIKKNNASPISPSQPTSGQTWFDTTINVLKVYNGTEWISFAFNQVSSFLTPQDPNESDLWFDKNINNLKVYDGDQFQRLLSSVESTTQPIDPSLGQFWTNTTTGAIYIYSKDASNNYFWSELGAEIVTEGEILPTTASVGAFHITRTSNSVILYVNKGSKLNPVWTEIPEHGGAIKSVNEPLRVLDGMFWLDGEDNLKIRKSGEWVDIDETAIHVVSDVEPSNLKEGMTWFDTTAGILKIRIGNIWKKVANSGVIKYGTAPLTPQVGELWYDADSGELKIFNGSAWEKVSNKTTIVGYQTPSNASNGQFWLDTNSTELKILKSGRWATLPENARAHISVPATPVNGDLLYLNNKLKIYNNGDWHDININVSNSVTGSDVSVSYDELSHEIVINNNGVITRVPLTVKRDIIIENIGITSDVVEVIKPDIKIGQRRILNIDNINLNRDFFVFQNGIFIDNFAVDGKDLLLEKAFGDDEINLLQFNGDSSLKFILKKFKAPINGSFTINNYTLTIDEQAIFDQVKEEYTSTLNSILLAKNINNASIDDLTNAEIEILKAIEAKYPIKISNNIADLSLSGIMVFKEGVFINVKNLNINSNNSNELIIPNATKGEVYTILQLVAGNDFKSGFFSKDYTFVIGAVKDNTEAALNVKGKIISDMLGAATADPITYGEIDVLYSYDSQLKKVTFNLIDINPNFHFCITRNNLYVAPIHYTIDYTNKTVTMFANSNDEIRFFQFYLPHSYVPIEFNYHHISVEERTPYKFVDLNSSFDLRKPILIFRNGLLQEKANHNVILTENIIDDYGTQITVSGLNRLQIFSDSETNYESNSGIEKGDILTIMQVSQPDSFSIYLEEFYAITDGINIFETTEILTGKEMLIFKNGLKLSDGEFNITAEGKLLIHDCNAPTIDELSLNPNAKGDLIVVHQFFNSSWDDSDIIKSYEELIATNTGSENFELNTTEFKKDEFVMIFKNGQMIVRRQEENASTTQSQINTFTIFNERKYLDKTPLFDANGKPVLDANGNQIIHVDQNNYIDYKALSIDNVVPGEILEIHEFTKKIVSTNNISGLHHHEILPKNNIQRIYTTKFEQLSAMTMIFQDGFIIDRTTDSIGQDTFKTNGMTRLYDQYGVDNISKSIIVNDWKIGGKLRVQQFTAQSTDIKTITLQVTVVTNGTYDVLLPNNETYTINAGALEVYVDRTIQWTGEDYFEVANNRIMFTRPLQQGQIIKIIIRK